RHLRSSSTPSATDMRNGLIPSLMCPPPRVLRPPPTAGEHRCFGRAAPALYSSWLLRSISTERLVRIFSRSRCLLRTYPQLWTICARPFGRQRWNDAGFSEENEGKRMAATKCRPVPACPQHIHRQTSADFDVAAAACCARIHICGQAPRDRGGVSVS